MSDRIENDAYYTPPELTRAFLARMPWGRTDVSTVAEPCAGDGWITRELKRYGYDTITGDIDDTRNVDFPGFSLLHPEARSVYEGADAVISNPPFTGASDIIRQAMAITPRVSMLLRLTFLEPCGDRVDLLQDLARVIVVPRVSFETPGRNDKRGTDSVTCAWFLWGCDPAPVEVVTREELEFHLGQLSLF